MVKVLQCHNFRSKKVIPIQDEPLAICANGSQLFVATRRCSVVVFSLPKENHDDIQEKRRFDTVSLVEKLLFSSASMLYGIINIFLRIRDYSDQVTTRPRQLIHRMRLFGIDVYVESPPPPPPPPDRGAS